MHGGQKYFEYKIYFNFTIQPGGEYEWSEELQGFILSSFYIGYIITHVPGGLLADKFGGKWTLSLGILSTAVFTVLTPWAIDWGGSTALIVLRILMGLGEGTTFPALSVLLSRWVPIGERGKLGALVLGGGQIGTILANSISGFLLHHFKWPVVFYLFGGLSVLWFLIFVSARVGNLKYGEFGIAILNRNFERFFPDFHML